MTYRIELAVNGCRNCSIDAWDSLLSSLHKLLKLLHGMPAHHIRITQQAASGYAHSVACTTLHFTGATHWRYSCEQPGLHPMVMACNCEPARHSRCTEAHFAYAGTTTHSRHNACVRRPILHVGAFHSALELVGGARQTTGWALANSNPLLPLGIRGFADNTKANGL